MAKLRIKVQEKREVATNPVTYDLLVTPVALTTDAGAVLGGMTGDPFLISGLTSGQAAQVATGTVYNCPIVV